MPFWYDPWYDSKMSYAKVAISIEASLLRKLDMLVKGKMFESRSQVVQQAIAEKIARLDKTRLATECAKLDKRFEQALADEGLTEDIDQWPEY